MAKQRGIVQLSGRVDNLCYYQQKRIRGGLVRRINLAMSDRLKIDPLFENTRKANTVFGMCSMAASTFLECFGLASRAFLYPDVQSKFTKLLLDIFKSTGNTEVGETLSMNVKLGIWLCQGFMSFAKNRGDSIPSFFPLVVYAEGDSDSNIVNIPAGVLSDFCLHNKIDGLFITVCHRFSVEFPGFDTNSGKYFKNLYVKTLFSPRVTWDIGGYDVTLDVYGAEPISPNDYVVVWFEGFRKDSTGFRNKVVSSSFYVIMYNNA